MECDSAEDYQRIITKLSKQTPDSIFKFAEYAFRKIFLKHPQAYVWAAERDYHTKQRAIRIGDLEDAIDVVRNIAGCRAMFFYEQKWINTETFTPPSIEPDDLLLVFNKEKSDPPFDQV